MQPDKSQLNIEGDNTDNFTQTQLNTPQVDPLSNFFVSSQAGTLLLQNGQLQSPNYIQNVSGWKVDSQGNADFQQITAKISQSIKTYVSVSAITTGDAVYTQAPISFDAFTESLLNATTNSFSHTVGTTSPSRILVVGIWIQNDGDVLTGITYNSVAMTLMTKAAVGSDYLYLYYLTNPSTGANTVNATRTGSAANGFNVFASSYYSAKQIGQPDNTNSASSLSLTLAANSGDWIVTMGRATGGNLTSGTNNTVRGSLSSNRFGDSNGAVTSGNQTVTFGGGGGTQGMISAAIVPATGLVASASASQSSTASGFIGFATQTVGANSSVNVVIAGEVTGLSNLTSGGQYYLANSAGTIATSAGTVTRKVGIATSSTTLLITNIW